MEHTDRVCRPHPFFRSVRVGGLSLRLCTAWLILFLAASSAFALPPQKMLLEGSSVHARDGIITLELPFSVDSEDGLRDLLKDGAVLELAVKAVIERERSWWANAKTVEKEFRSIIRHDPLSRDFLVIYPTPEGEKELRDKSLTRLLHGSWYRLSLPVASITDIPADEQEEELLLAVSVSLQHTEVPPWLKNSSIFWSSEIVPSEKLRLHFFLPGTPAAP